MARYLYSVPLFSFGLSRQQKNFRETPSRAPGSKVAALEKSTQQIRQR